MKKCNMPLSKLKNTTVTNTSDNEVDEISHKALK
jgi:hypothetical protein